MPVRKKIILFSEFFLHEPWLLKKHITRIIVYHSPKEHPESEGEVEMNYFRQKSGVDLNK